MTILLVGATGNVGTHLAPALAGRNDVRVLARRDADRGTLEARGYGDVAVGDLARPETLPRAFDGVERLFLLTPYVPGQLTLEGNALDAAAAAGVRRVVKVSFAMDGPDGKPITMALGHRAVEERLARSGMDATVLRPEWLVTNLMAQVEAIRGGGLVYPSPENVQHNIVDTRDIAEAAAAALLSKEPINGALLITGPEALTMPQLAGRIADGVGREVAHVRPSLGAWRDGLLRMGVPEWWADSLVELFEAFNRRVEAPVTDAVETMTGRPARRVDEFVRDFLVPAVGGAEQGARATRAPGE